MVHLVVECQVQHINRYGGDSIPPHGDPSSPKSISVCFNLLEAAS